VSPIHAPSQGASRPRALLAAAGAIALEALAIGGLGCYLVLGGIFGSPKNASRAEVGGLVVLLTGVALLLVARGLFQGRRWSRAPAVVTQIFCLPMAWGLVQAKVYTLGIPMLTVALIVLALLLSSAVGRPLTD
jgi:hypothetical protein